MSFVLTEKRVYSTVSNFYLSRFFRLYPLYLVVAGISLLCLFWAKYNVGGGIPFFETYEQTNWVARAILFLTNLSLIGQDWVMFLGFDNNAVHLTPDFTASSVVLAHGLVIPQAWTLGVEISFYAIAPFVLPRRKVLYLLLLGSILLRVALIYAGLGLKDPWTYRFFPTELALFLLGALAHQVFMPFLKQKNLLTKQNATYVTGFMLLFSCGFFVLPFRDVATYVFMLLGLCSLPFLFTFQNYYKVDRAIGELSYPIYISHMLFIWLIGGFANTSPGNGFYYNFPGTFILLSTVIFFSAVLNFTVGRYTDKVRRKFKA